MSLLIIVTKFAIIIVNILCLSNNSNNKVNDKLSLIKKLRKIVKNCKKLRNAE